MSHIEITPAMLNDLRQKAEADPKDWIVANDTDIYSKDHDGLKIAEATFSEDANYIAAACPAVMLALVAEVERLRDRLDDLICSGCNQQPKFCVCELEPLSGNETNFVSKWVNNADPA